MPMSSRFMKCVLLNWSVTFVLLISCSADIVATSVFNITCPGRNFKGNLSNVTCVLDKAAIPKSLCSIASSVVEVQYFSISRVGILFYTYRCDSKSGCTDSSLAAEQCHCFAENKSLTTYRFFFASYSTENEVVWCSIRCSEGLEIKSDECSFPSNGSELDYYDEQSQYDLGKASGNQEQQQKLMLTIFIPLTTAIAMLMLSGFAVWKYCNRSRSEVRDTQATTVMENLPTTGTELQSAPSQPSQQQTPQKVVEVAAESEI